jgi:TatD DNase family protein
MPSERILTESDGPFAQLNGQAVMPWHVERAIHELSAIWLLPPAKVIKTIEDNLRSLLERHA